MNDTNIYSSTGRRKTSVARLQLKDGSGKVTVNGKPLEDYFPTVALQNNLLQPLQVAERPKQYDILINTHGGGKVGQVGAIQLAMSRALILADPELRPALKKEGLLRRDPRMKERKKAGQPGARKRFQFSKR